MITKEFAKKLEKESKTGNAEALFYLGECYENGWGVVKDYFEAFTLFHRSALKNYRKAMVKIAQYHEDGKAFTRDPAEAHRWRMKCIDPKPTLKEIKELVSFGRNEWGELFISEINEDIKGNVNGNIHGNINGDIDGNINGDINGDVNSITFNYDKIKNGQ